MSNFTDIFLNLITQHKKSNARGFINIDCPACSDKRGRGGFAATPTNGFRYFCFNGGCDFNSPTGWEPGGKLSKKVKNLFLMLGGKIADIPLETILNKTKPKVKKDDITVYYDFDEIDLPSGTYILSDIALQNKNAKHVYEYLNKRAEFFIDKHIWLWSENYPDFLIIPYIHDSKIVGYLGRNITDNHPRFIQKSPKHFLFNQHTINNYKYKIVVESPMDAIAINGIGTRSSTMTSSQIAFLKQYSNDIILVPDFKEEEWERYYNISKENNWYLSVPDWGNNIKDVGESVQKHGTLFTLKTIIDNRSKNYKEILLKLKMKAIVEK